MSIPGFRAEKTLLAGGFGENLEMAFLDNHNTTGSHTLLLVHGLFGHKGTWRYLWPYLDQYRLIAPDLIGFGHSAKPLLHHLPASYRYSVPMHAEHLRQFILQSELDDLILAGNSLGGGISLCLALAFPELKDRIRGLVLIDSAGYPQELPGYIHELATWLGTLMNISLARFLAFRSGLVAWAVHKAFKRIFHDPQKIAPELLATTVDVLKTPNIFHAYRTAAQNVMPSGHSALCEKFKEITCPTLVIWGREDRIIPVPSALRFKEDLPHADLHIIAQCGHSPHLECPEQVAAFIEGWTNRQF